MRSWKEESEGVRKSEEVDFRKKNKEEKLRGVKNPDQKKINLKNRNF